MPASPLPVPPHQVGLEPREASGPARLGQGPDRPVGGDRFGLPLEGQVLRRSPFEQRLGEPVGGRPDQDGAGFGRALEPGGGVDRVPHGAVFDAGPPAHEPEHGRAGGDAHPDVEPLDAPGPGDFCAVGADVPGDLQGRQDRPFGVVLVRRGRAEQGQHAVAGQVLDGPAERLDRPDDAGHGLAHDEPDLLGVEPFAQRGGADEVGEQRRDDLSLLSEALLVHGPIVAARRAGSL